MNAEKLSGQGPPPNKIGISFLIPVLGYRGVKSTVDSITAQRLAEYEILILRNGIADILGSTEITVSELGNNSDEAHSLRELLIREKGKGIALNIGLQKAAYDIVCVIDADCTLDPLAAQRLLQHFSDKDIAAAGGRLQVGNNPKCLLSQLQEYEYMRAFLVVRPIYAYMNAQCLISGAFGMFRKKYILKLGGYDVQSVGEDMELILRFQENYHGQGMRIEYNAKAVCKTAVPQSLTHIMHQRDRWQRGLLDSLIKHWRMLGNPWYGLLGLLALPYQLIFELLGPVIILAYILSAEFREAVSEAWFICIFYVLVEVVITFYAAYLDSNKDKRKSIRGIPKLILLGVADVVLQIILVFTRIYGMATYWWRKTEW